MNSPEAKRQPAQPEIQPEERIVPTRSLQERDFAELAKISGGAYDWFSGEVRYPDAFVLTRLTVGRKRDIPRLIMYRGTDYGDLRESEDIPLGRTVAIFREKEVIFVFPEIKGRIHSVAFSRKGIVHSRLKAEMQEDESIVNAAGIARNCSERELNEARERIKSQAEIWTKNTLEKSGENGKREWHSSQY